MFITYLTVIRFTSVFFGEIQEFVSNGYCSPASRFLASSYPQQNQDQLFLEVKEFLVMLYGFAFLFEDLARHVETLSVYQRKRISYILTLLTHL